MAASLSPPGALAPQENATGSTIQPAAAESAPLARIDFAYFVDKQFIVHGWVLGLATSIASSSIRLGNVLIDLTEQAIQTRRADVAQHFSLDPGDDKHGFYFLVDLPDAFPAVDHLMLNVTSASGNTVESRWPVFWGGGLLASVMPPYVATLKKLLLQLPKHEAQRLTQFLIVHMGAENSAVLPPPLRFELDFCCLLESRIVVLYGWLFDPADELEAVQLRIGEWGTDFLKDLVPLARSDLRQDPSFKTTKLPGFVYVRALARADTQALDARFVVNAGGETVVLPRPIFCNPQEARREFLSFLNKLDGDSALNVNEVVVKSLGQLREEHSIGALLQLTHHRAIERLPSFVQHARPRFELHVDKAVPVAEKGIFLAGWFNAEPGASVEVVCHCGSASFPLSSHWDRHVRTDVTTHLASVGIRPSNQEHGYSCYVPLKEGDAPYYLSITTGPGEVMRMRVAVAERAEAPLDTIQTLLSSLPSDHRNLRRTMESHIGPAVGAAWAARYRQSEPAVVRTFGPKRYNPAVSMIVPLYGRYDFAEYQMALFANDPDFESTELIYVVDDPSIFDEFRTQCADLHGLYQVPFVLAFPGSNLGFAGANNFGAKVASGEFLILANSDVLPKQPGWIGSLLQIYKSVSPAGLLGVKLLYEDGSVQHAGITFRRHAPWDDMWINDHPLKGQSPLGLRGTCEVPAVTAACALIEAKLYRELGGLSEDYIVGDFEDSDLCLRAFLAGRRNYIALDVELYHLERMSQNRVGDFAMRTNLTAYNCWLHNERWSNVIERIATCNQMLAGGGQ